LSKNSFWTIVILALFCLSFPRRRESQIFWIKKILFFTCGKSGKEKKNSKIMRKLGRKICAKMKKEKNSSPILILKR
jgi:hypothetical protein